jgi:hypothetical protein
MTLTINDTTMTSDHTPHAARNAPDRNGWEISWLPAEPWTVTPPSPR